jgi:hypothetical protein
VAMVTSRNETNNTIKIYCRELFTLCQLEIDMYF